MIKKIVEKMLRITSRKRLRTKVTPNLHLTYSKNGENQGLILNGIISP